jgi:hypothetical protein
MRLRVAVGPAGCPGARKLTGEVCLLGGVGLANAFEELEVRRLPSHHALLLLCRQLCAHPVHVEIQPRAGLAESFHLVVSQERPLHPQSGRFITGAKMTTSTRPL